MSRERARQWIIKAMEDMRVMEHEFSFSEEDVVTSAVCFHAQQAVEKFLKAFLVLKGVEFGKTHNLELLLELCKRLDPEFERIEIGNLTQYAIEVRYPDEFYIPTLEEAKEEYEIARQIKDFILEKTGLSI